MSIAESYEILPPSREGRVPFSAGETWYRITGDLGSGVWGSRGAACWRRSTPYGVLRVCSDW